MRSPALVAGGGVLVLAGVLMSSIGAMACFVVSAASYVPFIGVAL